MKKLNTVLLVLGLAGEVSRAPLLASSSPFGQTQLPQIRAAGALLPNSAETDLSGSDIRADSTAKILEAKLAEARAQLAAYGNSGSTNAPAGVSPQEVWMRRVGWHRLVWLYEQQLGNAVALETARTRRAQISREAEAWTRFSEPPPYSIQLADRLHDELQAERHKISNGEAAVLSQLIQENRDALKQAEGKIRQLNEQLETASAPGVAAQLSWQRDQERLRSQVAAASIAVLESERLIGQETLAESRIRAGLLQRKLVLAETGVQFTQADLEKIVSEIDHRREQLERELNEAKPRRLAALQALEAAQEELRRLQGHAGDAPAASRAMELVSVRETQLDEVDTACYVLRLMLEGISVERTMWELRYAGYDSRSVETLRESERRLIAFARRLDLWRDYARQQLEGPASQLQETRLNSLPPDSWLLPLARERLTAMHGREAMLLRLFRGVERVARLTERWGEELRAAEGKLPLIGRVRNMFSDARSFLQRFWTFEIFMSEDTITVEGQKITGKRSVTVGKTVTALLILVVGYWMTGLITAFMEPIIVKRLKIEPNQANLIRRWLRALLLVCLLLFSLISVKIPLTVFAFAGGALAIGLGFGMQTLLKNFFSGLILLFERPFQVGDVLNVGGQTGTITSIGLRASVLHLWDGTETLIPNSFLLENNVTNWTFSDSKVRFAVSLGVAYGSDLRQVMQLLNEALERHGLVEKEPKPQVLFTDFGDSTLDFELRFWVDVATANAAQISSDLRLMIASTFAEHAIVIAFPQRDLHLHADRPIPMQVVPMTEARVEAAWIRGDTAASDKPPEML